MTAVTAMTTMTVGHFVAVSGVKLTVISSLRHRTMLSFPSFIIYVYKEESIYMTSGLSLSDSAGQGAMLCREGQKDRRQRPEVKRSAQGSPDQVSPEKDDETRDPRNQKTAKVWGHRSYTHERPRNPSLPSLPCQRELTQAFRQPVPLSPGPPLSLRQTWIGTSRH